MDPITISCATFVGHFRDRFKAWLDQPIYDGQDPDCVSEPFKFLPIGDSKIMFRAKDYSVRMSYCVSADALPGSSDELKDDATMDYHWDALPDDERTAKLEIFDELMSSIADTCDGMYSMKDPSGFDPLDFRVEFIVKIKIMVLGIEIFKRETCETTDPHGGDMFLGGLGALKYALAADSKGIPMPCDFDAYGAINEFVEIPDMMFNWPERAKRGCITCGVTRCTTHKNPKNTKLYHCVCDARARYCSKACQRVHWLWGHREMCSCRIVKK
jgi:hypothetical protein